MTQIIVLIYSLTIEITSHVNFVDLIIIVNTVIVGIGDLCQYLKSICTFLISILLILISNMVSLAQLLLTLKEWLHRAVYDYFVEL